MVDLSLEEKEAIKKVVMRRKIGRLVHFTRVENLQTIFQKGLVPQSDTSVNRTLNNTRDGNKDSICLSISHISNMFYTMRQRDPPDSKWCILVLRPDILWAGKCKLTEINGVSNILKERDEEDFYGATALEKMFASKIINSDGAEEQRQPTYPDNIVTNPQAEIRVHGAIPADYLQEVHIHEEADEGQISGLKSSVSVKFMKTKWFFHKLSYIMDGNHRKDYLQWLNAPFF